VIKTISEGILSLCTVWHVIQIDFGVTSFGADAAAMTIDYIVSWKSVEMEDNSLAFRWI
jgi:hypothetical protein